MNKKIFLIFYLVLFSILSFSQYNPKYIVENNYRIKYYIKTLKKAKLEITEEREKFLKKEFDTNKYVKVDSKEKGVYISSDLIIYDFGNTSEDEFKRALSKYIANSFSLINEDGTYDTEELEKYILKEIEGN